MQTRAKPGPLFPLLTFEAKRPVAQMKDSKNDSITKRVIPQRCVGTVWMSLIDMLKL